MANYAVPLGRLLAQTESVRGLIRDHSRDQAGGGPVVVLDDLPARYRLSLLDVGARARSLIEVDGRPALPAASIEEWIAEIEDNFHFCDSSERVAGKNPMLRRWAFQGMTDQRIDSTELSAAVQRSEHLAPLALQIAEAGGAPVPESPARGEPRVGLVSRLRQHMDRGAPESFYQGLVSDHKIAPHEVWRWIHRARGCGGITPAELREIRALRDKHQAIFTPSALSALDAYLGLEDPTEPTRPRPHDELRALWNDQPAWDLSAITPPGRKVSHEEHLERSFRIFRATNEDGYRLANEVKSFFERYPSTAGQVLSSFFAGWAINETFHDHPLQAYNYFQAHPVDENGEPRGALWKAYADAVDSGAPRAIIEEAFFRATISDYKRSVDSQPFRQMYQWAPESYRKAVDAYLFTLRSIEADLNDGKDPVRVAQHYPLYVTRELVRRGTIGMVWNRASFVNGLNPTNPLTQEWWNGFWGMLGRFITGAHRETPPPTQIRVNVNAQEAASLQADFGLDLKPGTQTIKAADLIGSFRGEPRGPGSEARPSFALTFADFTDRDPLHPELTGFAGVDGVYSADEIRGVVRQVQAKQRSQLLDEFHAKYPVPMNGWLVYSANMLALTGSYAQHPAYGMVPEFIMPVNNLGEPKTELWQRYVDAYERHKSEGRPSLEELQRLWLDAHMEDFRQVDGEEFQAELADFWARAVVDPALEPLATYFIAMVHGRDVFDAARDDRLTHEQALRDSFAHFRDTIISTRSIPFWRQELGSLFRYLGDPALRNAPELDARGLPTKKALFERALRGLGDALGVLPTLLQDGGTQQLLGIGEAKQHTRTDELVDLDEVLTAEDRAKVHPMVKEFYRFPGRYEATGRFAWGMERKERPGALAELVRENVVAPVVESLTGFAFMAGQAFLRGDGIEEGTFPLEWDIEERDGVKHWNRYIIDEKGRRELVFRATFETVDGQLKETFRAVTGEAIEIFLDVRARDDGGIEMRVDRDKSHPSVARWTDIAVRAVPAPDGRSLRVQGDLDAMLLRSAGGEFELTLQRLAHGPRPASP